MLQVSRKKNVSNLILHHLVTNLLIWIGFNSMKFYVREELTLIYLKNMNIQFFSVTKMDRTFHEINSIKTVNFKKVLVFYKKSIVWELHIFWDHYVEICWNRSTAFSNHNKNTLNYHHHLLFWLHLKKNNQILKVIWTETR